MPCGRLIFENYKYFEKAIDLCLGVCYIMPRQYWR
nr:MAG TPA: hypothetical protein [Caudoviricetes sp.]